MPYCGACKQECKVTEVDDGIGTYEYWGAIYHDSRKRLASDCCEEDVFEDEACTKPYEPSPPEDRYEEPDPAPREETHET